MIVLSHMTWRISSWSGSSVKRWMMTLKWNGAIQALLIKGICQDSSLHCPWTPRRFHHELLQKWSEKQQLTLCFGIQLYDCQTLWLCYYHLKWDLFYSAGWDHSHQVNSGWDFLHFLQCHKCPQEIPQEFPQDCSEQRFDPNSRQELLCDHHAISCCHG